MSSSLSTISKQSSSMGTRSSISKDKPEWSEGLIQRYLSGFFSQGTKKYEMDGLYVFAWESDKLIITRSGWTYEFEIKISRSRRTQQG